MSSPNPFGEAKGWSEHRCARLGYLVGIGWDAGRVGADAIVDATPREVHEQASRLGLRFREETRASPYNLDGARMAYFTAEARLRRFPVEALLRKLLEVLADDRATPTLLGPPATSKERRKDRETSVTA